MKTSFALVLLLAALIAYYFQYTPPKPQKAAVAPAPRPAPVSQTVIIASAPSAYNRWMPSPDRWKCGPNAQTNLRVGPNAQTDFAEFAPSEQANWNPNPGYTMVSGSMPRVH
jgi:hypothetical protein